MSSDRTGRALGTLNPVKYFQNSDGHIVLASIEIGKDDSDARRMFELRFKPRGYEWREAGTLSEVDTLQKRLIAQEQAVLDRQGARMDQQREHFRNKTASDLRQRMQSRDCSPFERDFIGLWLEMGEEKRKEYAQRFTERNMYLQAREMDSGTRVEDRMKD